MKKIEIASIFAPLLPHFVLPYGVLSSLALCLPLENETRVRLCHFFLWCRGFISFNCAQHTAFFLSGR